ncbi:MAG: tripartite tricarboxylate transporter substrate binding protein [Acetobacteraceae bacterium]
MTHIAKLGRRDALWLLGVSALFTPSGPARAAGYPDRPITMIVPYGPGGGVSINARALAPFLEKQLGQRITIENREGAGGIVGHDEGAHAKPDGYTLTMVSPGIVAAPWLVPNVAFSPTDFAYIGQVTLVPTMVVVAADSPYKTLADLVAAMKVRPGQLSTGALSGWPSATVAQAIFFARAGVTAKIVPGFHGGAEMVTSVIGHHIDFGFVNLNEAMPLYEGKRLRILAVSSPGRSPSLPDVPTFRDLGYDVAIGVWRTLAAPKATPQPILDKLSTALKQALDDPALKPAFAKLELSVDYLDPQATRQLVMTEYEEFGKLFTEVGLNVKAPTQK